MQLLAARYLFLELIQGARWVQNGKNYGFKKNVSRIVTFVHSECGDGWSLLLIKYIIQVMHKTQKLRVSTTSWLRFYFQCVIFCLLRYKIEWKQKWQLALQKKVRMNSHWRPTSNNLMKLDCQNGKYKSRIYRRSTKSIMGVPEVSMKHSRRKRSCEKKDAKEKKDGLNANFFLFSSLLWLIGSMYLGSRGRAVITAGLKSKCGSIVFCFVSCFLFLPQPASSI